MTPQRDFLMYVMETYGNHLVWPSFHVIFAEFTKASDRNICIHGNLCRGGWRHGTFFNVVSLFQNVSDMFSVLSCLSFFA